MCEIKIANLRLKMSTYLCFRNIVFAEFLKNLPTENPGLSEEYWSKWL